MKNKPLREVTNWFGLIKAPDLKGKLDEAATLIESGEEISENQKKLIGFSCFSFSMNHGPASFIGIELLIKDIGVEKEFREYADNWINHSKTHPSPPMSGG